MKRVVILTQEYPFGNGESFLTSELFFYSKHKIEVVLVPFKTAGNLRILPSGVSLFENKVSCWNGWIPAIFVGMSNGWFWRELLRHLPLLFFSSSRASFLFFIKVSIVLRNKLFELRASKLIEPNETILYSYWLSGLTAGAIRFNQQCNNSYKIISRAHGGDVYDYRYKHQYIPFRKFLLKNINYVAVVSQDGTQYLKKKYPAYAEKIKCHYLGTHEPGFVCGASDDGVFRVVSCSFVVPVKRLHLIVGALNAFQNQYPQIAVSWTHLGGGAQLGELIKQAMVLNGTITCYFPGNQTQEQIMEYYQRNSVDLFVNTSSSEGIPVSIMEAMSVGIPVLATDVGGVRELVDDRCGKLISIDVTPDQIAQALFEIIKNPELEKRINAIERWRDLFNDEKNYLSFVEEAWS